MNQFDYRADRWIRRWVQTDMGNSGAILIGMKEAETPLEESVEGLVAVVGSFSLFSRVQSDVLLWQIDQATREKTSGRFPVFNGKECPW
jgi:norsolorinic acid ketoreductase